MREAPLENEQDTTPGAVASEPGNPDIYGEDGVIRPSFVAHIGAAIADRDTLTLKRDVAMLHQSEVGDLLEALLPEQRHALVSLLGKNFDFSALTEVDEAIRLDIVDNMPNEQIAEAVQELDSDDAVYILEDLDKEDQDEILAQLPFTERIRLKRSLAYPEESAGRRMQTEFVAVPPFWTVGQTIDYMREDKNLPDRFSQIFVIDPTFKLVGAVDLDQIMRAQRAVKIEDIMHETRHAIPATMDQEEAAREFEQYDLCRPPWSTKTTARRRAHHRRRGRRHPAGGRGGSSAHGRRRRRGTFRRRDRDIALARALAARQSRHRLRLRHR